MGKASRDKGKRFERMVALLFKEHFGSKLAYRGAPIQASGGCKAADVVVPEFPFLHVECSHGKTVSPHAKMQQAIRDSGGKMPVVVTRRDRGDVLVTLRFEDFAKVFDMDRLENLEA